MFNKTQIDKMVKNYYLFIMLNFVVVFVFKYNIY